ncbi:NUDIX hydrolase [Actinoplanes couchii]|nr:NUDIX domain-containing protein [Actinoplanes couchii]MDR6319156.1 ADP-ribose pyrophosphatase YjhB (NUDIX family) [Actinoplanes couchii]
MHPVPRVRVAAYVIRHVDGEPQLLVFDQAAFPDAGTQIPAGGVRPGEALPDAVVREIAEECGLTGVTVAGEIAVEHKPHPETGQPRRTTFFHVLAPDGTADSWQHTVTGTGSDSAMRFDCRFVALPLPAPLADHQDAQLHRIPGYTWPYPEDGN